MIRSSSRLRARNARRAVLALAGVGALLAAGASVTTAGAAKATVPGAPRITSVKAGNRSITVAFVRPSSDGGARISGYRAVCTSTNGGVSGAHNGTQSPIPVPSLSAARIYRCTVAAQNNVGTGPASARSAAIAARPTPPHPPKVTAVKAGVRAITVSFVRPADNGGAPVASYRAVCTSKDGGVTRVHQGSGSPITVAGLSAADRYTCTVAATNSIGLGHASAPSRAVIVGPRAPSAPKIKSAKAGIRLIGVAFTAPADNGGSPITSYRVVCRSRDGGATRAGWARSRRYASTASRRAGRTRAPWLPATT